MTHNNCRLLPDLKQQGRLVVRLKETLTLRHIQHWVEIISRVKRQMEWVENESISVNVALAVRV
jgi:hypothetical protein